MTSLAAPLKALASTLVTALGGIVTMFIATRFPSVHLPSSAVSKTITFVGGSGVMWVEHRKAFVAIETKAQKLLRSLAGSNVFGTIKTLDPNIVSQLSTQVATLTGKVEALLHLHAAASAGNANSAAAVTKTSAPSAKGAAATR